jgi:hypothetical protein
MNKYGIKDNFTEQVHLTKIDSLKSFMNNRWMLGIDVVYLRCSDVGYCSNPLSERFQGHPKSVVDSRGLVNAEADPTYVQWDSGPEKQLVAPYAR